MTILDLEYSTMTSSGGGFPEATTKARFFPRASKKPKPRAERLSEIKARFAANQPAMLEQAEQNTLRLTGQRQL